jgi:hypothetical protein
MNEKHQITKSQLREAMLHSTEALPEAVRAEVADKLTEEVLKDQDPQHFRGPISKSLTEHDTYYVVPGNDLNLAKISVGIAAAIMTVLKDPISLLGSLSLILFQFRKKAVKLDGKQGMVVLTLNDQRWRREGLTVSELTEKLPLKLGLSLEETEEILMSLKDMRRRGESTPVVREWSGRWWANEIW